MRYLAAQEPWKKSAATPHCVTVPSRASSGHIALYIILGVAANLLTNSRYLTNSNIVCPCIVFPYVLLRIATPKNG